MGRTLMEASPERLNRRSPHRTKARIPAWISWCATRKTGRTYRAAFAVNRSPASFSRRDGDFRLGNWIMDRKDRIVLRGSLRSLFIIVCASLAATLPLRVEPATAAPAAQLADGTWSVQGRAIPGRRQCGDWLVRLTNAGGRLSGVVSLARASVPIQDLTLLPEGASRERRGPAWSDRDTRAPTKSLGSFPETPSALLSKMLSARRAAAQPFDKRRAAKAHRGGARPVWSKSLCQWSPTTICEARRPMIERYGDHAANERTFLAWVRTAIAVMAFGFLVQKFDLFLRIAADSIGARSIPPHTQIVGTVAGLLLIVLGGAMMIFAAIRFRKTTLDIDAEDVRAGPGARLEHYPRDLAPAAGGHPVRLLGIHSNQSVLSELRIFGP